MQLIMETCKIILRQLAWIVLRARVKYYKSQPFDEGYFPITDIFLSCFKKKNAEKYFLEMKFMKITLVQLFHDDEILLGKPLGPIVDVY